VQARTATGEPDHVVVERPPRIQGLYSPRNIKAKSKAKPSAISHNKRATVLASGPRVNWAHSHSAMKTDTPITWMGWSNVVFPSSERLGRKLQTSATAVRS